MIAEVRLHTNGMVMALDEKGDQIAEYQGEYGIVVDRICRDFMADWKLVLWPDIVLATFNPHRKLVQNWIIK